MLPPEMRAEALATTVVAATRPTSTSRASGRSCRPACGCPSVHAVRDDGDGRVRRRHGGRRRRRTVAVGHRPATPTRRSGSSCRLDVAPMTGRARTLPTHRAARPRRDAAPLRRQPRPAAASWPRSARRRDVGATRCSRARRRLPPPTHRARPRGSRRCSTRSRAPPTCASTATPPRTTCSCRVTAPDELVVIDWAMGAHGTGRRGARAAAHRAAPTTATSTSTTSSRCARSSCRRTPPGLADEGLDVPLEATCGWRWTRRSRCAARSRRCPSSASASR